MADKEVHTHDGEGFTMNLDMMIGILIIIVGLILAAVVAYNNGQLDWALKRLKGLGNS